MVPGHLWVIGPTWPKIAFFLILLNSNPPFLLTHYCSLAFGREVKISHSWGPTHSVFFMVSLSELSPCPVLTPKARECLSLDIPKD